MTYVIIVDDRATNRQMLARLTSTIEENCEVGIFEDPASALASAERQIPDLIITDFNMPIMDGAEFIRRIRELEDCEDVPVIVVSAYEDRRYRYEALEAGATDFLRSPIDHVEFKARARNLLALRQHQLLLRQRANTLEGELTNEARRRRQAVRESRRRLTAVIDNIPAFIYAVDDEQNATFINQFALAYFGNTLPDRLKQSISEIAELKAAEPQGAGPRSRTAIVKEEELIAQDGERGTFLTNKTLLIDPETDRESVLTVSTDITERIRMEAALREAFAKADAGNRAKSQFLANMSHELRTPLNVVIGFSEYLANNAFTGEGMADHKQYCDHILQSGKHLLAIINDILELARIDDGDIVLGEDRIGLDMLIERCAHIVEETDADRSVAQPTVENAHPISLFVDERKIERVLSNVLSNAMKFSKEQGVITVSHSVSAEGDLVLEIADTGIGMSKEEIKVASSRFGQVFEDAHTKRFAGAGLGLPIAQGLMEAHGGRLEIQSEKGIGTRVSIVFPPNRVLLTPQNDAVTAAGR